ncbi:hypothetical protein HAZT_HAZT012238 [Hyalella azteca]|uniref:Neurotransmitter-gated ion-channel ligand-binding domain-containing protein n=1 Tax=Hyalella azteca TaxID=294128 RepID=A0A6A0GQZ2_HYAAZ|nr:hypothetical protein HAZT_HAZT012238 [Hyalella azteca]
MVTAEQRLADKLFAGYNKNIRPTTTGGEVTYVTFKISLLDIMEMDTRYRKLRINTELILLWTDVHLSWDPALFEGVETLRVAHHLIWTPDIILYNTAEPNYQSSILSTNAILSSEGKIELMSHAIFCSVCDVNVEFYPFDQQACQMKFSSWTYDVTNIVVSEAMVDIGHFNENPEFFLEDFYVTKTEEFNDCCPLPFSTLKYVVQLQRQSKFALFFYVVPGILINICGVYYGVCLSLVAINIAFSVYVLNLNYTGLRGFVVPRPMRRDAAIVSTKVEILSNSDNPDLPDHIRELFPDFVPAANQPPPLKGMITDYGLLTNYITNKHEW